MSSKKDKTNEPLQFVAKFWDMGFVKPGLKKRSERYYIFLPPEMVNHPEFPLKKNEVCMARIEGKKLVIFRLVPDE